MKPRLLLFIWAPIRRSDHCTCSLVPLVVSHRMCCLIRTWKEMMRSQQALRSSLKTYFIQTVWEGINSGNTSRVVNCRGSEKHFWAFYSVCWWKFVHWFKLLLLLIYLLLLLVSVCNLTVSLFAQTTLKPACLYFYPLPGSSAGISNQICSRARIFLSRLHWLV